MVKLLGDVLTETVASASGADTPATSVIGVRPKEIADRSLVGSLLDAVQLTDLVEGVDTWGETTVEAEDLVLDDSGKGQVVEQFSELFPNVGVAVLSQALVVEAVPVIK